jgi:hypothetical protein
VSYQRWVPPGSDILVLLVNVAAPTHARTVRPLDVNCSTSPQGRPASMSGHGPFDPKLRTVRAAAESTIADTPCSDWCPDQHQHTFITCQISPTKPIRFGTAHVVHIILL